MPTLICLVILGVIQGMAEFLPVSSSGHLVLSKFLLTLPTEGVLLEVALHAGTLVPILIFYRKRILALAEGLIKKSRESWYLAGLLIVATIPAIVLHVLTKDLLEGAYQYPVVAAAALCVTGIILIIPIRPNAASAASEITLAKALLIGGAQAFAMIPGISRSGSTITMARHLGITPAKAAEFSFFMAIPVLFGAILLELPDLGEHLQEGIPLPALLVGMGTAAIVGYFALALLVRMLEKGKFWIFGIYCILVGSSALAFHLLAQ